LQIREKGLALGSICYWLFQFMFVEVTPIAIEKIYYKFYIILAVLNCFNATMIWLFFPETARKSLEEIDYYFVNTQNGKEEDGFGGKDGNVIELVEEARKQA